MTCELSPYQRGVRQDTSSTKCSMAKSLTTGSQCRRLDKVFGKFGLGTLPVRFESFM